MEELKKIEEIVIDTGQIKFALRDATTKELYGVISFNPVDFNILNRFEKAKEKICKIQLEISEEVELDNAGKPIDYDMIKVVNKINKVIKEQIDYIFDSPISDSVFGNKSPMASVRGKLFFEVFLEAVFPIIEKKIKENMKETEKRTAKYTAKYRKK